VAGCDAFPAACTAECAPLLIEYYDSCQGIIAAMAPEEKADFEALYGNCREGEQARADMTAGAKPQMIFDVAVFEDERELEHARAEMLAGAGGVIGQIFVAPPVLTPADGATPAPPAPPATTLRAFTRSCTKANLATCIPACVPATETFLLNLQVEGRDTVLMCVLADGVLAWVGQAGLGGFVGENAAARPPFVCVFFLAFCQHSTGWRDHSRANRGRGARGLQHLPQALSESAVRAGENAFVLFFSNVVSGAAGTYIANFDASPDVHTTMTILAYQDVAVRGVGAVVAADNSCEGGSRCDETLFGTRDASRHETLYVDGGGGNGFCAPGTDAFDCGWPLGAPIPAVVWGGGFSVAEHGRLHVAGLTFYGQALEVLSGGVLTLEGAALDGGSLAARQAAAGALALAGCILGGELALMVEGTSAQQQSQGTYTQAEERAPKATVEGGVFGEFVSAAVANDVGALRLSGVTLPLRALVKIEAQLEGGLLELTGVVVPEQPGALYTVTVMVNDGPCGGCAGQDCSRGRQCFGLEPAGTGLCCGLDNPDPENDRSYVDMRTKEPGRFAVAVGSPCVTRDGGRCVGQPGGGSGTMAEHCEIEVTGGGGLLAATEIWTFDHSGAGLMLPGWRGRKSSVGWRWMRFDGGANGPPPAGLALSPGAGALTWDNKGWSPDNTGNCADGSSSVSDCWSSEQCPCSATWEVCFAV
jgi:hypothetical protein